MTVYITLNEIRNNHPAGRPCKEGWTRLLYGLGKTYADDEPFPITFVLENNGLDHALWCVECLRGQDYAVFNLKADIAESVLHIFEKKRPDETSLRNYISAMRSFAKGEITRKELDDAGSAAGADVWFARGSARVAAWAAAWAASDSAKDARAAESAKQAEMFRKWLG